MERLQALVGAVLAVACGLAFAADADRDFVAARTAFERGDRSRLDALAPRLAGHVLEPYVVYWRLRLGLDEAQDAAVRAYLARWPDTPLSDRLAAEWLKVLGKRGQWTQFASLYPPGGGGDVELACYAIQFRRTQEGDAALAAARPLWLTGQPTPEPCEPLFAALIASGEISPAERHARFRLASEAGNLRLARSLVADLPPGARISSRDLAVADANPVRALADGDFRWNEPGGRELALYALERAARTDAAAVRAAWEKQRARLPEAERRYGNARLALHAARQHLPEANAWFGEAPGADPSETERAWRVRAALRAGVWSDVLRAIEAMPALEAQDPAWRYWKARALGAGGHGDEAAAIWGALAGEFGFYAHLAAEALGRRIEPASAPLVPDAAALAAFGARPGVRRAVKLAELDMRADSQREWGYVVRGLPDEALLLAAGYARGKGLHDRSINTAERTSTRHDFALRYPLPYREHFAAAARDNDVDEALLFGIARQESRFAPDVVSSAGAVGLMQLMPATARWVARQRNHAGYRPAQIGDVTVNTQFGAYYFKYWLERLERLPALAAAAYNAGPGRAQAWRNGAPIEGAIWVETIPLNETRDYVKKVLANTMFYARVLEQPHVPLARRLGVVPMRGAGGDGTLATLAR
jgi:soluble lytic murein transglycosylase